MKGLNRTRWNQSHKNKWFCLSNLHPYCKSKQIISRSVALWKYPWVSQNQKARKIIIIPTKRELEDDYASSLCKESIPGYHWSRKGQLDKRSRRQKKKYSSSGCPKYPIINCRSIYFLHVFLPSVLHLCLILANGNLVGIPLEYFMSRRIRFSGSLIQSTPKQINAHIIISGALLQLNPHWLILYFITSGGHQFG